METLKQALENIKSNWSSLPNDIKGGHEAVWLVESDQADSYEVDEEWIGIKGDGSIVWAYASGCSCWDGEYDAEIVKDIKVLKMNHKHLPEEWEKAIIKFSEEKKLQELPRYNHYE